jgi:hypothetical protein
LDEADENQFIVNIFIFMEIKLCDNIQLTEAVSQATTQIATQITVL